ncbi:MAG: hypothetical protein KAH12_04125 [Anaerolineales bacterium]|nr:hypothetical protein [Anaerolineales bacterium]
MEEGIRYCEVAQLLGVQTTGTRDYSNSYYPISAGWNNIKGGTSNEGMSLMTCPLKTDPEVMLGPVHTGGRQCHIKENGCFS